MFDAPSYLLGKKNGGGSGKTGAYKVNSVAEMEAIEDMQNGDYCIIDSYSPLPTTYQEVEYLESTGTQYINTEYAPNMAKTNIKFRMLSKTSDPSSYIAGIVSSNPYAPVIYSADDDSFEIENSIYLGSYDTNAHAVTYNDENNKVYFDGIEKATTSDKTEQTNPLYLFSANFRNAAIGKFIGRIYYFKMTDKSTGNIVRDMIPCYRKSDGEIGMYDTVNDTFYTNNGTGKFIVGGDVGTKYHIYQYTNNQWIQV